MGVNCAGSIGALCLATAWFCFFKLSIFLFQSCNSCLSSPTAGGLPQNLKVTAVTQTSLTVTWEAPPLEDGPVDTYLVNITAEEVIPVDPTKLEHTFTGLVPYGVYTITVRTKNSGKAPTEADLIGPAAETTMQTKPDGT